MDKIFLFFWSFDSLVFFWFCFQKLAEKLQTRLLTVYEMFHDFQFSHLNLHLFTFMSFIA